MEAAMSDVERMCDALERIRDIIQEDVGKRGLRADPERNPINACPEDFRLACHELAERRDAHVLVVTGFFIPTGQPPAGETDGPLGAVFLARSLLPLGIRVSIATDSFCAAAMQAGLDVCGLGEAVAVVALPSVEEARNLSAGHYLEAVTSRLPPVTHLLAIERVGPAYTTDIVPPEHRDRCHTMRGRDITDLMSPAHLLFEAVQGHPSIRTIGIGDGGNEIGMGKIPWEVIRRNIPGGDIVACRVATERLIVCGISNWGAYGLGAGVALVRGTRQPALFDPALEKWILEKMVQAGPLVDGVTGRPEPTVDGLPFERYAEALVRIGGITT
jgi:hypothetical protein